MWRLVSNRAVGPAAIQLPLLFTFLEAQQEKQCASRLSRYLELRLKHSPQFLFSLSQSAMTFSTVYESLVSFQSGDALELASSIAKKTASHEEAMLLEEPHSDERHAVVEAIVEDATRSDLLKPITVEGVV